MKSKNKNPLFAALFDCLYSLKMHLHAFLIAALVGQLHALSISSQRK